MSSSDTPGSELTTPPTQADSAGEQSPPVTPPVAPSEEATPDTPAASGRAGPAERELSDFWAAVIGFVFIGGIISLVVWGVTRLNSSSELDVIGSARRTEPSSATATKSQWTIEGRVLDGGQYVESAIVWAVVTDDRGQQYAPDVVATDKDGKFAITLAIVEARRAPGEPLLRLDAVVQAKKTGTGWGAKTKQGRRAISLTGTVQPQVATYSTSAIWLILIWFGASFVLAFATCMLPSKWSWWSYHVSVALTFTLSLAIIMAFYLAVGELVEKQTTAKGEVVTLGFINIFEGTFLREGQDELLVSLSSPAEPVRAAVATEAPRAPQPSSSDASSSEGTSHDGVFGEATLKAIRSLASGATKVQAGGFGAPLWVIVLAVIGATLLTVTMVLQEIESPPDFNNTTNLRTRVRNIVAQQLFMLFAPLGGIFLYQTLLAADAAEQPLAVGTAALGAGASLNYLLAKAVEATGGLLKKADGSQDAAGRPQRAERAGGMP